MSIYRWRNDDGDQATATLMAPENIPIATGSTPTTTLRLRSDYYSDNPDLGGAPYGLYCLMLEAQGLSRKVMVQVK